MTNYWDVVCIGLIMLAYTFVNWYLAGRGALKVRICRILSPEWLRSRILCGVEQREELQKQIKGSKHIREFLEKVKKQPMFEESQRRKIWQCVQEAICSGIFQSKDVQGDWQRFYRAQEEMGQSWPGSDIAFCASANFNLVAGSLLRLGTEKHRYILDEMDKGKAMTCFALTEIKYGVMSGMQMETTAEYDPVTQLFSINSNSLEGGKDWITNLSEGVTKYVVLFAVLKIKGRQEDEGVHGFVINIRDDADKLLPGIKIEDCGRKNSFAGVWTSRVWFNDVKAPLDALLDRHSQVLPDGSFSTSLGHNPRSRFFAAADQLMSGRLIIASISNSVARNTIYLITNALAFRCQERMKKDQSVDRTFVLDTLTAKKKILSHICEQIGLSITLRKRRKQFAAVMKSNAASLPDELVNDISGLKYYAARSCLEAASTSIDLSGSRGALEANLLHEIRNGLHTLSVIEGDKMIMMQKCAGELLKSNSSSKLSVLLFMVKAELLVWVSYLWTWLDPYCYTRQWFLNFLLRARENIIISRLLRKVSRGRNAYVWHTRCLTLAQELCDVYVERMIVNDIMEEKGGCIFGAWQNIFSPILTIFMLSALAKDKGNLWVQENRIHETIEMISANTNKQSCVDLVEAFVHKESPFRHLPMVSGLHKKTKNV